MLPFVLWLASAAVAGIQAYSALTREPSDRLADLSVYVGAAQDLLRTGSLYDFITANDAPFTYPPFAGLLMVPLANLDLGVLQVLWTLATILVVYALAVAVSRLIGGVPERWRNLVAPALALVLFASAPVSSNIRFGQVSVFLAFALVAACARLRAGADRSAGVLVGITAAIKLTPLLFVPGLFLAKRRAAWAAIGTFAVATAIAAAILFHDSVRFWAHEIWNVNRVGHITTNGNQSFNGVLLRLGVAESARTIAVLVFLAAIGSIAIYRFHVLASRAQWLPAFIVLGCATVAVSPVSWTHHQVWLVLAVALPIGAAGTRRALWIAAVILITVLPLASLSLHLPTPVDFLLREARFLLTTAIAALLPLGVRNGHREEIPDQRITDDEPGRRAYPGAYAQPRRPRRWPYADRPQ